MTVTTPFPENILIRHQKPPFRSGLLLRPGLSRQPVRFGRAFNVGHPPGRVFRDSRGVRYANDRHGVTHRISLQSER